LRRARAVVAQLDALQADLDEVDRQSNPETLKAAGLGESDAVRKKERAAIDYISGALADMERSLAKMQSDEAALVREISYLATLEPGAIR